MIVEVLPVPGGPWSSMCGNCRLIIMRSMVLMMSSCATNSCNDEGLYFSTQGSCESALLGGDFSTCADDASTSVLVMVSDERNAKHGTVGPQWFTRILNKAI